MAKISTYPSADSPLLLSDRLIGTEAIRPIPSVTPLATKNFSLGELLQLFSSEFPAPSLQQVLNTGNTAIQNIYLTGTIDTTLIKTDNIEDTLGSQGATFQYLSKATTGINWVDLPVDNLQSVLDKGNTATQNIILTGNITSTKITPTNIQDESSNIGLLGQVLTKSASGIVWQNNPTPLTPSLNDVLIVGNTATNDILLNGDFYGNSFKFINGANSIIEYLGEAFQEWQFPNQSGVIALEPWVNSNFYRIPTGTISQYIRGDGTLATFPTIPTVGTWGTLNYPNWTTGTPFVKMTATGTFSLDTNIYLTGITSSDITTALGYTPANNANVVHLTGNENIAGYKNFTAGTTVFSGSGIAILEFVSSSIDVGNIAVGDYYFQFTNSNVYGYVFKNPSLTNILFLENSGYATFINTVQATSFKLTGGTSSQFLKADGTVDSNTYITSASLSPYLLITTAASTYYPIPVGTISQYIRGNGTLATFPTIPTVTPSALTKVDDTNVTLTLGGTPSTALLQATSLTLGWTGTLADSRITSASTWNAKQNAITLTTIGTGAATFIGSTLNIPTPPTATFSSLTTTGSSGSSTLALGVLNVPTYTLSGLGGQPQLNGTGFVKISGTTISYDNSSYYLTSNPSGFTSNTGTVTSVAALTLGTTGTDLTSTVASSTTNPVITLNVPTASAANRGALSSADWTTFNNKQNALTNPITGTGTINYIPKFTGANSLGNSSIQDNGSLVTVTNPITVNGLQTFQGTVASDTAPLGAELTTTGTGTNWTGTSFATGYTHTTGSTVALTSSLAAVNGTYYQIITTISGRTAGTVTVTYGGISTGVISTTNNISTIATSTATLSIIPTTDFNGVVVLSIKTIGVSSATTTWINSSGVVSNEIRASSVTTNYFSGINTGSRNTIGSNNTGVGVNSLQNNTTGYWNTSIGYNSLVSNTTGYENIAIGYQSLTSNKTGIFNTSIGTFSLVNNTTGNDNIAIGKNALSTTSIGNSNVSIGNYSLQYSTSGGGNTAIGYNSLQKSTIGTFNTSIGYNSLQYTIAGATNTSIGASSLLGNVSGSNNVSLGSFAGTYIYGGLVFNTNSNNSIFLGNNAYPLADNQTNQTVIGYNATGLGSNTTVLGNASTTATAIYGDLLLGSTVDNGTDKLQVTGTIKSTSSVQVGNNAAAASATNVGAIRYYADTNNSYADMVMQTGASTYTWVNIVKNTF